MDLVTGSWLLIFIVHGVISNVSAHDVDLSYPFSMDFLRLKPYYVFTAPEILHPGEHATIGVTLSQRLTDVIIHVKLETWHGGKTLASVEKLVRVSYSDSSFLLHLKVPKYVRYSFAVLKIRMLQYPYKEQKRIVRILKRKPKVMLRTNKGHYLPGEDVELWVLAIDRNSMPYKGKVQSSILTDSDGVVIDHSNDVLLTNGIASITFSSSSLSRKGKHLITVQIDSVVTKIFIDIGKASTASSRKISNPNRGNLKSQILSRSTSGGAKDTFYSPSGAKMEIIMQGSTFKAGTAVVADIVYDDPKNGQNIFTYEIICDGIIHEHQRFVDLYSTMYCGSGIFRRRDVYKNGPSRDQLCARGQNRFFIEFEATEYMQGECRFLVYKILEDREIIIAKKTFRVVMNPKGKRDMLLKKRFLEVQEDFSVIIPNAAGNTVLFIGKSKGTSAEADGIIAEENIRKYQENKVPSPNEASSTYTSCEGKDYVNAKQSFKNCGLRLITSCNSEPEIPCSGRRTVRFSRSYYTQQDLNSMEVGGNMTSWLLKRTDVPEGKNRWKAKLRAPAKPGKYILQAILVSNRKGIHLANSVEIVVKDKEINSRNLIQANITSKYNKTEKESEKGDIEIQIKPDLSQKIFSLHFCQPLIMQICSRRYHVRSGGMYIVTIEMVPSFYFDKKDLQRALRREKHLVFYIDLSSRVMLYLTNPRRRKACFSIKLKQRGRYREDQSKAEVTYVNTNRKGEKRSFPYWIKQNDCM